MQDILNHTISINKVINICLTKNVSFSAYKLPGQREVTVIIQKDPVSSAIQSLKENFPAKGFLIAPFLKEAHPLYLIRPDLIIRHTIQPSQLDELMSLPDKPDCSCSGECPAETEKDEYIQLVEDSIHKIKTGDFEKVVLSRVKIVSGKYFARLDEVFRLLGETYTGAFVYLFCVNGECWTGATPEPFICTSNKVLKTVSLAGTRTFIEYNLNIDNWNSKELLEQEYVTRHIEKTLHAFKINDYNRQGPYVARAGNLLHLRTDFTFTRPASNSRLAALIDSLHPTPAICGMSTGKAMEFINAVEKHNREYYSGYLGPVGIDDELQLFVNLRCLKVFNSCVALFVGGGITSDSVPEEEWRETDIKAETLLSVLRQF